MKRVSLAVTFGLASGAVALVVGAAFALFLRTSRAEIAQSSERRRVATARRVEKQVLAELGRAEKTLEDLEKGVRTGAISASDSAGLEAELYTRLIADEHLEEVTFTHADIDGYDPEGDAMLGPNDRWQVSVYRSLDRRVISRLTKQTDKELEAQIRERARGGNFLSAPLTPMGKASDPTKDFTFSVLASKTNRGRAIWSDLHWAELDQAASIEQRRVVLSVQKSVDDAQGRFVGVLRVGLLTTEIDAIGRLGADETTPDDPTRIALLSVSGDDAQAVHLVAKVDPSDRLEEIDGELRVVSDHPPKEVAALLASPIVTGLDPEHPNREGMLDVAGERYLATLRELDLGRGGTTGWCAAVLVPESYYTKDLLHFQKTFLWAFGVTLGLVVLIAGFVLFAIRRGLAKLVATTSRMRDFEFSATTGDSVFRDVDDVMQGLERAKTVVRAMGKYVPMDLVRRLYHSNEEPSLGGEQQEVSLLFTDIEGFTTLSEKLPPDELALCLGDYLEVMTVAIQRTEGTIDKYIGDAVMAIWNAPTPVEHHARKACRAALDCMADARALYASPRWKDLPPLVTRFGIHRATVLVGNFGAPTRLTYTALGDGVNLAARLEPLCKQYGVEVLVSETIVKDAGDAFVFRRIDRVAVKGKAHGIDVYELLGAAGDKVPLTEIANTYTQAFDAYLARDFAGAASLLGPNVDSDPPSAVLHARCEHLQREPPPAEWNGVHVAKSK